MDSGYAEYTHLLDEMEYEVAHHYRKAERELTAKVEKYYKDFARLDAQKQADVNAGKITEAEYRTWRKNKLLSGKVWEQRKDTIAKDLYNANYIARNLIGEGLPDVYAIGHNFATYQIEQAARVNTSYVLYNHEAVERLIADNPDLIPYQQINFAKDVAWNKRNLQALMIQGILQGESIPHLAKRVPKTIIKRNRECTIRNARTMATSAYNGGKMDAFNRAKRLGIDMKVRWRATFDDRTRDSHRALDGEVREVGEAFSNGLTFPCDMSWLKDAGHGLDAKVVDVFREKCAETYNCRCTIQGVVAGFESRAEKYRVSAIEGLSYEDWKKGKNTPQMRPKDLPKHKPEKKAETTNTTNKKKTAKTWVESQQHKDLITMIKKWVGDGDKIDYKKVEKLKEQLTIDDIIKKIGGGDKTKGSCSSLTYAYIGNRNGLDVTDFRGGNSQEFFSKGWHERKIDDFEGVDTQRFIITKAESKGVAEKLRELDLPKDKEYRLSVGKHAAIIRNTDNGYEYLELQSATDNGWHSFTKKDTVVMVRGENGIKFETKQVDCTMEEKLHDRFGTKIKKNNIPILDENGKLIFDEKGRFIEGGYMDLSEVSSFKGNKDFEDILGYLNTAEDKQKKGKGGHEK